MVTDYDTILCNLLHRRQVNTLPTNTSYYYTTPNKTGPTTILSESLRPVQSKRDLGYLIASVSQDNQTSLSAGRPLFDRCSRAKEKGLQSVAVYSW